MFRKIFCGVLMVIFAGITVSADDIVDVSGRVFEDVNHNGVYDSKEDRIVANMLVSDGDTVITCKKNGTYRLKTKRGNSVFPILPAGYDMPTQVPNASFRYIPTFSDDKKIIADFAIIADEMGLNPDFTLNAVGDVQTKDLQEIEYASRTIFSELAEADNTSVVNVWLGDLCFDNLSMLPILHDMMNMLPSKSWTVMGNHDRDYVEILDEQNNTYNIEYGACDYSFNRGNVHFIVLNSIIGVAKKKYKEGLRPQQLRFIKNDLAHVPVGKQIVFVMHAPVTALKNKAELMSVLEGRGDILAISGHWHQAVRHFTKGNGVTVHDVVAGSTCGYWWRGERDWNNVPSAIQQCGTPRNYHVFDFTEDSYSFKFKGLGMDAGKQMSIYISGIDTTDVHVPGLLELPKGAVVANIWGACDSTNVECVIDGKDVFSMTKAKMKAPDAARLNALYEEKVIPTKYSRRGLNRKRNSPHVWSFTLPESYQKGVHTVVIKAKDDYGFSCRGVKTFHLE